MPIELPRLTENEFLYLCWIAYIGMMCLTLTIVVLGSQYFMLWAAREETKKEVAEAEKLKAKHLEGFSTEMANRMELDLLRQKESLIQAEIKQKRGY